jgi:hypothetical protein
MLWSLLWSVPTLPRRIYQAHVFEAFAILSALGWGQPHSIGHYIDLGATVLGVTFIVVWSSCRALTTRVRRVPVACR